MKKYLILLLALGFMFSCNNDDYNNNNRYLPNYNFSVNVDMNLPQYSQLMFASNAVYVTQANAGINGVIVMNTGSGYAAYEATCPNQEITTCSILDIQGVMAVCPCDDVEYSLFTGLANSPVEYPLKPYRVELVGQNVLRIYN